MGLIYHLEDYARYQEAVGEATVVDISRRCDPARIEVVWERLCEIARRYGAPWVVQLWTKDLEGTLRLGGDVLRDLVGEGTTVAAQLTVTGLAGSAWEPLVPADGFRGALSLAELAGGPDHIKWRYDPIIPTIHRAGTFRRLAEQAASLGITQGILNFLAPPGRYARVDRRLATLLPGWAEGMPDYDEGWRQDTARELVAIAGEYGLSLACCAEYHELADAVAGLGRAACSDYAWFAALSGRDPGQAPFRGSRPGCGCARYFDLGSYGQWFHCHRCAYCYAG